MARLDKFFHVLVMILALVVTTSSSPVQASTTVKDFSTVKDSSIVKESTTVDAAADISGSSGLANSTNSTVTAVRPTPPGMNFTCDDRDVSDKYYFQFNEANLYCSNTLEWYANWTIYKQTELEWSIGEWKAFSGDFVDDYNLDCSAARATCLDITTRWELQRIHPGPENRELVRRIFFVFHLYSLMHDYENNMEKAFEQIHFGVLGLVKELIFTFTHQEDQFRVRACNIYHTMTSTAVNMCVSVANTLIMAALGPFAEAGAALSWLSPVLFTSIEAEAAVAVAPVVQAAATKVEATVMEEVGQVASEDTAKALSEGIITKGFSKGATKDLSGGTTKVLTEATNKELSKDLSEGVTKDLSKGLAEGTTKDLSKDLSDGVTKDLSEGLSEDATKALSKGTTHTPSEGANNGHFKGTTKAPSEDANKGHSEGTSKAPPDDATKDSNESGSKDLPTGKTNTVATGPIVSKQIINQHRVNFLGNVLDLLPMPYAQFGDIIENQVTSGRLNINGGMGLGTMCAAEGGDFKNNNDENIKKLQEAVADNFANIRKKLRGIYRHLYNGHIMAPGEPSLMATVMLSKAWFGPGSVTEFIADTLPMEEHLERSMVIDLISRLLAESYNYMKCAHREDAVERCEAAKHATKYGKMSGKLRGKWNANIQYWCPKPDDDPTLVCSVLKYYFARNRQHEEDFDGWGKLENFACGRYNLSWPVLFQESWENYEKFRNDYSTHLEDLFLANGDLGPGFFLPTCVNENIQLENYNHFTTIHHDRWNFPPMCGDFRSNETAAFMNLMNIGVQSAMHKNGQAKEFWRDRLPRSLHKNVHISPFSHYMALCAHGMHWPQLSEKEHGNMLEMWKMKWWGDASDQECAMIDEATKDMDSIEANHWFCIEAPHTVFQRERDFLDTSEAPYERYHNHREMCKSWEKGALLTPKEADHWLAMEAGLLEKYNPRQEGRGE